MEEFSLDEKIFEGKIFEGFIKEKIFLR